MNRIITSIICIAFAVSAFGSSDSKKTQRLIAKGERAYDNFVYTKAVEYFEKALEEKEEADAEVCLKIADSYRLMNKPKSAEKWYAKVTNYDLMTDQDLMNYTQTLLKNGKDAEAKAVSSRIKTADLSQYKRLNAIEDISTYYRDSLAYFVENMNVNTEQSEFSPTFVDDGFAFVSNRERKGVRQASYGWDDTYFLDLYYSEVEDGQIMEPKPMTKRINTIFHEGPATFFDGGNKLIFTRNNFNLGEERTSVEGINKLKLYYTEKSGSGKWSRPVGVPFNSDDYSVGHPTFDEATQTLYFASDMPGGFGKSDIYKVSYTDGKWGTPENLGNEINTVEDDLFPYIDQGSKLYFASHGHPGIGGLDIYEVNLAENGEVTNMGFPINTPDDDFGMVLRDNAGFLSSNREGGRGNDDLYMVTIYAYDINARLVDAETGVELSGELNATEDSKSEALATSTNGKVSFNIVRGRNLNFSGSSEGYESNAIDFKTATIPLDAKSFTVDVPLSKLALFAEIIKVINPGRLELISNDETLREFDGSFADLEADLKGKNYKITKIHEVEAIYYDFDKSNIREDAALNLDKLVALMEEFGELKVVLAAHTDSRGSNAYNEGLAKRRVDSAKEYLLAKGVDSTRILMESFGETQLLNDCEDGVNCDQDAHQLNRRTEVSVKIVE